jgi:hypothetical protein
MDLQRLGMGKRTSKGWGISTQVLSTNSKGTVCGPESVVSCPAVRAVPVLTTLEGSCRECPEARPKHVTGRLHCFGTDRPTQISRHELPCLLLTDGRSLRPHELGLRQRVGWATPCARHGDHGGTQGRVLEVGARSRPQATVTRTQVSRAGPASRPNTPGSGSGSRPPGQRARMMNALRK